MADYNPNNGGKQYDINTFGPSFYNEKAGLRLSTSHWKSNLSLSIEKITKEASGNLVPVKGSGDKISISGGTISALEAILEDALESIKATGTFESDGVECGVKSNNLVAISNGSEIDQAPGMYLVIYKDLDDNRIAGNVTIFPFNQRITVRGYNPKTGAGKAYARPTQELKEFKRILSESAKAATKAIAHQVRDAQKSDFNNIFKSMNLLLQSAGISMFDSPSHNRNGNSGNQRRFQADLPEEKYDMDDFAYDEFDSF